MKILLGANTPEESIDLGNVIELLKKFPNSKINTKTADNQTDFMKNQRALELHMEESDLVNFKKIEFYLNLIKRAYVEQIKDKANLN